MLGHIPAHKLTPGKPVHIASRVTLSVFSKAASQGLFYLCPAWTGGRGFRSPHCLLSDPFALIPASSLPTRTVAYPPI